MGTSRNELCKQVPRNCLLPDCSASELLRKQEKRGARAMLQEARALREGHSHQELLFFFWLCWVFDAVLGFSLGERGLLSSFGARATHCSGSSCGGARALGHSGLSSRSFAGSAVVAPRL